MSTETNKTVTTAEVENPQLNDVALGILASELAWEAVLSIGHAIP